jgi:hypothetical protein
LEGFMTIVDGIDDIALSEEIVDGENKVRLWAETGRFPATLDVAELIAGNLSDDEIAIIVDADVRSAADVDFELTAVNAAGNTLTNTLDEVADSLKATLSLMDPVDVDKRRIGVEDLDAEAETYDRQTDTLDED